MFIAGDLRDRVDERDSAGGKVTSCGKSVSFRMAPIHHHFEALGWQESEDQPARFWTMPGRVLAANLFALTTLKLQMKIEGRENSRGRDGDASGGPGVRVSAHSRGADVTATDLKPQDVDGIPDRRSDELFDEPWETHRDLAWRAGGFAGICSKARAGGVEVIGRRNWRLVFLRGPVIGITGSNGKTTTTSLVGHIPLRAGRCSVQVGGNI